MQRISYLSSDALNEVFAQVANRIEWYFSNEDDFSHFIEDGDIRHADIQVESLKNKLSVEDLSNSSDSDLENALIVYRALKNLQPFHSSDSRLWTYLTHVECKQYVYDRWLRSNNMPNSEEAKLAKVRHFFCSSFGSKNRSSEIRFLFRENAVARLWWLGYLAEQVSPEDPEQFLTIILHKRDVLNQIQTRSTTANRTLLRVIYEILAEDWEQDKQLFHRDVFRDWMGMMNLIGGVILLDTLSKKQLKTEMQKLAEISLVRHENR